MSVKKNNVLITGATSGIGLEFSRIFAEKGYNLVIVGRNEERLNKVNEELLQRNSHNIKINIITLDLTRPNAAEIIYDYCDKKGLFIDILINNAGMGIFGDHVGIPIKEIEKIINLNILALTNLCSLFGNEMKKRRYGYILNVASTTAYHPFPYFASYAATKSYVLSFSEALAKELEDFGVYVTCLSPGKTDTDFSRKSGITEESGKFSPRKKSMLARSVAEYGVKILFAKKISGIPGFSNRLLAFALRFIPRKIVAFIAKKRSS